MAIESWFPIGFELPDGACCGRAQHGTKSWQILETPGGGCALVAKSELVAKWVGSGLIEEGDLHKFSFGSENFCEISCGSIHLLAPVSRCRSPGSKSEALAFAAALRDTRAIDRESPLQDAVYVEKISRLLPSYEMTARLEDDVVLGFWLTGGVPVSVMSFRRLHQIVSWLESKHLRQVIDAAGFEVIEPASREPPAGPIADGQGGSGSQKPRANYSTFADGLFELPGRPELQDFFNEHVIDIIHNRERYETFGVSFPAAIVLHGPPGCGKTFAVEQLIEYLGWPSFQIDSSSVASPYIHETSRKVAEVFDKAMQNAPSVLVIDEMEAFLADRETGVGGSHHRVEEVAEFLRRIPEAAKNQVLIVAMTNRVEMIDSAIMRRGRFDHIIKVDFASNEDVLALLEKLLASLPRDKSVDPTPLAKKLTGRPLSDVTFIVREAARLAARCGASELSQEYLLAALESAPSRTEQLPGRRMGFV